MLASDPSRAIRGIAVSLIFVVLFLGTTQTGVASMAAPDPAEGPLPALDDFSPALLGVYRKVMSVESDILRYARHYGVDASLARAVCMFESGGNSNLASSVGAQGLFQVMPSTFRLMHVQAILKLVSST